MPSVSSATREYARVDGHCGAAVWGAALRHALRLAGCSQLLRAAYRTDAGRYVGLMALLNLRDSVGADRVIDLLSPFPLGSAHRAVGFLLPLDPPTWLSVLGKGYSEARIYVAGHYVLLAWVARADGKRPSNDYWNLGKLSDLLTLPSAFAARGPHIPPAVVHIYVSQRHPSRCVMPKDVPRYSSLDVVVTGNTFVRYVVPELPGATSAGMEETFTLGSPRGAFTSHTEKHVIVFSQPGTYFFHVEPAQRGSCKLVVR